MSFVDTTFVIDLLREQRRSGQGRAHDKLRQLGDTLLHLSVFAVCELEAGAALHHDREESQRVQRICACFEVVYPDEHFAHRYGTTLAELKRRRITVATMDLLIGVHTLVYAESIITRNLRHFQHIPYLQVEAY